jgi:hypothetical protein
MRPLGKRAYLRVGSAKERLNVQSSPGAFDMLIMKSALYGCFYNYHITVHGAHGQSKAQDNLEPNFV